MTSLKSSEQVDKSSYDKQNTMRLNFISEGKRYRPL